MASSEELGDALDVDVVGLVDLDFKLVASLCRLRVGECLGRVPRPLNMSFLPRSRRNEEGKVGWAE